MRVVWGVAVAALAGASAHGAPGHTPEAAAACVAVIERQADVWADRARNGDASARAPLRTELEHAAVLIGQQYLAGSRDEELARARLERARKEQDAWPEDRRAALHRSCSEDTARLLAASNSVERYLVRRLAAKRMQRLLAPTASPAASRPA